MALSINAGIFSRSGVRTASPQRTKQTRPRKMCALLNFAVDTHGDNLRTCCVKRRLNIQHRLVIMHKLQPSVPVLQVGHETLPVLLQWLFAAPQEHPGVDEVRIHVEAALSRARDDLEATLGT